MLLRWLSSDRIVLVLAALGLGCILAGSLAGPGFVLVGWVLLLVAGGLKIATPGRS